MHTVLICCVVRISNTYGTVVNVLLICTINPDDDDDDDDDDDSGGGGGGGWWCWR